MQKENMYLNVDENIIYYKMNESVDYNDLSKEIKKLDETDVGISEYINKNNAGFYCILKHRYSDFIVNEIDIYNNVVFGTKRDIFKTEQKEIELKNNNNNNILNADTENPNENEKNNNDILKNLEHFKCFFNKSDNENDVILPNKNYDKLYLFISDYINDIQSSDCLSIDYIESKEERKDFHEKIRKYFPFLDSTTDTKKNKILVLLITNKKYKQRKAINNNFNNNSNIINDNSLEKKYISLTLLKKNLDTNYVINYIAKNLKRSCKTFKYAGTKDKRGITTQNITIFKVKKQELDNIQSNLHWDNKIELSNYNYTDNELALGMLNGNQFSVVLRFLKNINNNTEKDIKSIVSFSVNSLKEKGFINYYGMQRFGSGHVPTHLIGKELINGNWKEAVIMILNGDAIRRAVIKGNLSNEIQYIEDIITNRFYIKCVLSKLIGKSHTEKIILNSLYKDPNNYYNAYKALNRNLRLLYIHAYQSYIWNQVVSYRISKYGLNLIEGDLVASDVINENNSNLIDDFDENNNTDLKEDLELINTNIIDDKSKFFEVINKDNISKYNIDNLYIPLIRKNNTFGDTDIDKYTKKLLIDNDKINLSSDLLGKGDYRKVIQIPKNIEYAIIDHIDSEEDLQTPYYNVKEHPKSNGTNYKSLRLQFQLPQSTYATMVFRELTKLSSSFISQTNLTIDNSKL